jgi:hypothetical protein
MGNSTSKFPGFSRRTAVLVQGEYGCDGTAAEVDGAAGFVRINEFDQLRRRDAGIPAEILHIHQAEEQPAAEFSKITEYGVILPERKMPTN